MSRNATTFKREARRQLRTRVETGDAQNHNAETKWRKGDDHADERAVEQSGESNGTQSRDFDMGRKGWQSIFDQYIRDWLPVPEVHPLYPTLIKVRQNKKFPGNECEKPAKKINFDDPVVKYVLDQYPEAASMEYPPTGSNNMIKATHQAILNAWEAKRQQTREVTPNDLIGYLDTEEYSLDVTKTQLNDFTYTTIRTKFYQIMNGDLGGLRKESMAGFPAQYEHQTKGAQINDTHKTWCMFWYYMEKINKNTEGNVPDGYGEREWTMDTLDSMPYVVIPKQELHSQSKVKQGRFRTLQVCGLFEYALAVILLHHWDSVFKTPEQTNYAIGEDLSTTEGRESFKNQLRQWNAENISSCDVSGYEWSTTKARWILFVTYLSCKVGLFDKRDLKDATIEQLEQKLKTSPHKWVKTLLIYTYNFMNAHVIFQDGSEYVLQWPDTNRLYGRNPSGCKTTSFGGSFTRALLEWVFHREHYEYQTGHKFHCKCMGDDTVSNLPKGVYEKNNYIWGLKITDIMEHKTLFEFCGYKFDLNGKDEFKRVVKTLYTFANSTKSLEQWQGLVRDVGIEMAKAIPGFPLLKQGDT